MVDSRVSGSHGGGQLSSRADAGVKPDIPPPPVDPLQVIRNHLHAHGRFWLFLDYDGTLVPIAPTPQQAVPDPALLRLLTDLAAAPRFRVAILSGRALSSLQALLPVPGLILAGLYGIQVQMPDGTVLKRAEAADVRHTVASVKEAWSRLVGDRAGFLIEDKGLAVALHARHASPADAEAVLSRAETVVAQLPAAGYRILGGHRFLEIAPSAAHKGRSVEWLLDHGGFPDALPVYIGDDDKDEEAFGVVLDHGGIPIIVGTREPMTRAMVRLKSPQEVRELLDELTTID